MQPSQTASKSSESPNSSTFYGLAVSITFTAVLVFHRAFSAIFRIFWCGLSSSVFWSSIISFLEFLCTVQACCRFTSSGNRVVSPAVLTIYTTVLKWFSVTIRLFSFFCATQNVSCYRFSFAPFIWLDSCYIEIFRPWASRSRFTYISSTAYK